MNESTNYQETKKSRIIVAIDTEEISEAHKLINILDPNLCRLKVGKGLFTQVGPSIVETIHKKGFDVFLDLKFHDIPNTVAHAVSAAAKLGVWMVNVHASGGEKMLQAARSAIDNFASSNKPKPILIAVTLLTSLSECDVAKIGYAGSTDLIINKLASISQKSGLDGVVCSAREAKMISQICGQDFISVCPGIRTMEDETDDQKRTMSPKDAISNGAHYLVIGRPITQNSDPNKILDKIMSSSF